MPWCRSAECLIYATPMPNTMLSPVAATPCASTVSMRYCSMLVACAKCTHSWISRMLAFQSAAGCCSREAARCAMMRWLGAMRAAADARGVDIIQNCEVTGIKIEERQSHRRRDDTRLHRL